MECVDVGDEEPYTDSGSLMVASSRSGPPGPPEAAYSATVKLGAYQRYDHYNPAAHTSWLIHLRARVVELDVEMRSAST